MDDAWGLQLTAQTLTDANNVRLHLRINTLSEITDHTGTTILPSFYNEPTNNEHNVNTSGSTLQWPNQPSPGKRAWRAWQLILNQLYLKTNSTKLTQKLGPWLPETMNDDWKWNWKICPSIY